MQQDRVDGGFITEERRYTIRTQCNHFLSFVGHDRKMDTIKRERYKDYYLFRRKEKPNLKSPTLLNERAQSVIFTSGHWNKDISLKIDYLFGVKSKWGILVLELHST